MYEKQTIPSLEIIPTCGKYRK